MHGPEIGNANMTKRAFDKIKAGLDGAKAFLEGTADKKLYRVHVPSECENKEDRTDSGCRKGLVCSPKL